MPNPGTPPNEDVFLGNDGRPSTPWQRWFSEVYRTLVPRRQMYIPTIAGTPTFTPEDRGSGQVAMVYDTNNDRLYVYNGSWVYTTLS